MEQIIIPEENIEKYTRMILLVEGKYPRYMMTQPIPIEIDKGIVYTIPPKVLTEKKVNKLFTRLFVLGEIDIELKDMPVQDITIIPSVETIDKKK